GPLPRDHGDEAVARHTEEPQAAQAPAAVPRDQGQALLQARHRATGAAIPPRAGLLAADPRVGDRYLSEAEIAQRVEELAEEIDEDYASSEPLLVAALKASVVFLADLSRELDVPHELEFVELAAYGPNAALGGHSSIRLLKDLGLSIEGRDVLIVE